MCAAKVIKRYRKMECVFIKFINPTYKIMNSLFFAFINENKKNRMIFIVKL